MGFILLTIPNNISSGCHLAWNTCTMGRKKGAKIPGSGKKSKFKIPAQLRQDGMKAIECLINSGDYNTTAAKIVIQGKIKGGTPGTDQANQASICRYEGFWAQLLDFCIFIKDYESGIILHRPYCPADPPPVHIDTAIAFLRYRYLKKGTQVKHHRTNHPVLDHQGNALVSIGDWTGSCMPGLLRSALSKLHVHYDTTKTAEYVVACPDCASLSSKKKEKGHSCAKHPNKSYHRSSGCCTRDPKFSAEITVAQEYIEHHYLGKTTFPLIPMQLRQLRQHLLGQNTHTGLMYWTMIVVGVKLFLRVDEILNMKVEDFQTDHFLIKPTNVEALAVRIFGKCDKAPKDFYIWEFKDCPDLDACKAILIWLQVSGIKSGYLFPSAEQLKSKCSSPSEHLSYTAALAQIKTLVTNVLGVDFSKDEYSKYLVGTHILRKTAFLLASWALLLQARAKYSFDVSNMVQENAYHEKACLLLSGRHETVEQMSSYLCDSPTLKKVVETMDPTNPQHKVGRWECTLIENNYAHLALSRNSQHLRKPVVEIAEWYLRIIVKVTPEENLTVNSFYNTVYRHVPDFTIQEKLDELLRQKFPDPSQLSAVKLLIQQDKEETFRSMPNQPTESTTTPRSSPQSDNRRAKRKDPVPVSPEEKFALSRDYQTEARGEKDNFKKCRIMVDAVAEAREQMASGKKFSKNDQSIKSFIYRAGASIDCLENCYAGDTQRFLEGEPNACTARFKTCQKNSVTHRFNPTK